MINRLAYVDMAHDYQTLAETCRVFLRFNIYAHPKRIIEDR
jgi:hypothetical protein